MILKIDIKTKYTGDDLYLYYNRTKSQTYITIKPNNADVIEIRIGKDCCTTINQTNQILKIMNLPYELVDEIDWSEVRVGTKIKYNRTPFSHKESSVGQFHSYIKELNKITIIDGYDLIVKDVNECKIIN
jgi:hypothetical protein